MIVSHTCHPFPHIVPGEEGEEDVARRLLDSNETLSVHSWNRGGGISMGEVGEGTIYGRLVRRRRIRNLMDFFDIFLHVYMCAGFAALPGGLSRRQNRRGQKRKLVKKYVMKVNMYYCSYD